MTRSSSPAQQQQALDALLDALPRHTTPIERHLWLYDMLRWVRGNARDVQAAVGRVRQCLLCVQASAERTQHMRACWSSFMAHTDATPLLADYGFAPRSAFLSELGHRLARKWLPATPETRDAGELFDLLFEHAFDAQWMRAIDASCAQQWRALLYGDLPERSPQLSRWQHTLLDALIYSVSQTCATGFASEIRTRMAQDAATTSAFHNLAVCLQDFVRMAQRHGAASASTQAAAAVLRERLSACRAAAGTVYAHLDAHGVSVGIVFRLRQLRERIVRVSDLLDCLLSAQRAHSTTRLLARLIRLGHERRSVGKLLENSTHLTAAKVAERHAAGGENYITRTARDWRVLALRAAGGGLAMGFAVWFKFALMALALSIFWSGLAAGLNYAIIFVIIELMHWTVATKQPALTAPAMAARLKDMDQPNAIDDFVEEVTHLMRSQIAAIVGNLLAVAPAAWLISAALRAASGAPMLDAQHAAQTLGANSVLGPTALFAAFTGVLLFASGIIGGWVENWFVLHRLDSAIAWHPRSTALLGAARARRWSAWWRAHIGALASNISLGLLLGLAPAFALFFGLGLQVRHVTLVAGQVAASVHSLGWQALTQTPFWLAAGGIAITAVLNLAVGFYMAFRTALAAHNVPRLDRRRIYSALLYRLRRAPGSFFFPPKASAP